MISKEEVLFIHSKLIEEHGGSHGVRDDNSLEASINRPFATFDGIDLYPTAIEKAAAVFESIIINHPFIDGNKRTGYSIANLFLYDNGYDIKASQEEKYDFVIEATKGNLQIENIIEWFQKHSVKL